MEIDVTGKKYDDGKPQMELLDSHAIEELTCVLTFGAQKYGADNWREGIQYRRLIGACLRHIFAWMRGIDADDESGLHHLAHAMCCLMFIIGLDAAGASLKCEDRFGKLNNQKRNKS